MYDLDWPKFWRKIIYTNLSCRGPDIFFEVYLFNSVVSLINHVTQSYLKQGSWQELFKQASNNKLTVL